MPANLGTAMLAAHGLTKRFGDRTAVDGVSLEITAGETLALVGPNGAGKTTMLRMLCGLVAPTAGTVTLDGQVLTPERLSEARRHIGLLTESPGLWDRMSVRENLLVYARLYELERPHEAVDRVLLQFGLHARANDRAAQLSKGLRQRVALARTLVHDPAVVLLDEPTSGLDPESAKGVRDLIAELAAGNRAVLICSHNLTEVDRLASRVAILRARVLAFDTPAALRARYSERRVHVDLHGETGRLTGLLRAAGFGDVRASSTSLSVAVTDDVRRATPAIVRMLVEGGAQVEGVRIESVSLEEAYLRILADGGPA